MESRNATRGIRPLAKLFGSTFLKKAANHRPVSPHGPRIHPDNPSGYSTPTDADLYRELRRLGLDGRPFNIETDYRQKLEEYFGWTINVRDVADLDYPLLQHRLDEHGIDGGIFIEPAKRTAWVVVRESSLDKIRLLTIAHELSHFAGFHKLRYQYVLGGLGNSDTSRTTSTDTAYWDPFEHGLPILRDTPAPQSEEACELEANRRAAYLIKAHVHAGEALPMNDAFFMGVRGRPSTAS